MSCSLCLYISRIQQELDGATRNEKALCTFTFSHLEDAFIQSDLQLGST